MITSEVFHLGQICSAMLSLQKFSNMCGQKDQFKFRITIHHHQRLLPGRHYLHEIGTWKIETPEIQWMTSKRREEQNSNPSKQEST